MERLANMVSNGPGSRRNYFHHALRIHAREGANHHTDYFQQQEHDHLLLPGHGTRICGVVSTLLFGHLLRGCQVLWDYQHCSGGYAREHHNTW